MPLQQDSEPENKSEKLKREPGSENEKAKAEIKAAVTRAKAEERARLKAEKALSEAQAALEAVQVEMEQERKARIKAEEATAEAERAVVEVKKSMGVEGENFELSPPALLEQGGEQRVTFVLRITVDERGQPRRMEVEHAQIGKVVGKKETFPSLDMQRLAAFIQERISPPDISEPSPPSVIPPIRTEEPVSEVTLPVARLTVSKVQVSQAEPPGVETLILSPDKAFVIQIQFELLGPEVPSLVAQEYKFEIKVYANEVVRGTSSLLTAYQGHLVKDVLEYTAQLQVTGLSPGFYRLLTLVALPAPINMAGYYEGPVLEVVEIQPTPNLVAPL